jgi:LysR family transcriptional regulator for metE and metH
MHLEIRHLRLIQAICNEGSVTRASNRLHLTQSALSHQLRDIEDKLGAPLFTRINKRMVLTPVGQRLLNSADTILAELQRAEEDIRQISLSRDGILRISTECYTCYHWLPALLKIFSRDFPRIEVQIVAEATRDPHQALLDGKIDLALVSNSLRESKLVYEPLFRDELVVILSKDHPLRVRSFIRAEDFINERLLIYAQPSDSYAVQHVLAPAGVVPGRISSVPLTEAIVEMVKARVGLGILSRWSVAPQIESGMILARPLTRRGLYRRWSAATLKNKSTPAYLRAFVKLLADNSVLVMNKEKRGVRRALKTVDSLKCDDVFTAS